MMVDPAVASQPNIGYEAYDRGAQSGIFLRQPNSNGSFYHGIVWPGVVVYPDWFHPSIGTYWTGEFKRFFDTQTGIDIDGAWIDMNEPANFCSDPCNDPFGEARQQGLPPNRAAPPPPDVPIMLSRRHNTHAQQEQVIMAASAPMRNNNESGWDLSKPPYAIKIATKSLSDRTADMNIIHYDGTTEYDARECNFFVLLSELC